MYRTKVCREWNHMKLSRELCRVVNNNKLCGRPPQYAPTPCDLHLDPLTLKVVSDLSVTWATSLPILVFLGLSVLDLGPMYATNVRQTDVRRQTASSRGRGHNNAENNGECLHHLTYISLLLISRPLRVGGWVCLHIRAVVKLHSQRCRIPKSKKN